jgi:hypothetical protein
VKITNQYNLPDIIVNVVERPTYSKGKANISATQLLNSPKIVALTKKYEDAMEQDVSGMIWSILGSAMHGVLEHGKNENSIVEQRLHAEVDGWLISGAVDLQEVYPDGIVISDYKLTSVWSVMNDKPEWEQQLNIYAWLIETQKKVMIKGLNIVAFLRDWNSREAEFKENYPRAAMVQIPITLWPLDDREAYIKGRIAKHSEAEYALETGEPLPDCTPKEMWEKPTTYAVKKINGVRAKFVFEDMDAALKSLEDLGKDYEIEIRPGDRTRCANYCQVNKWCKQYERYLIEKNEEGIDESK